MLVSHGTRVALKANPPSPVTEPLHIAEQTPCSDTSLSLDLGAPEQQLEPKQEVLEQ